MLKAIFNSSRAMSVLVPILLLVVLAIIATLTQLLYPAGL
jgi:hypothetical protein